MKIGDTVCIGDLPERSKFLTRTENPSLYWVIGPSEHEGLIRVSSIGTDCCYIFPANRQVHLISLPNEDKERAEFIASLPESECQCPTTEDPGLRPDPVGLAIQLAALSFGGTDRIFNSAGFSNALAHVSGVEAPIAGALCYAILQSRSDVEGLSFAHWVIKTPTAKQMRQEHVESMAIASLNAEIDRLRKQLAETRSPPHNLDHFRDQLRTVITEVLNEQIMGTL